MTTASNWLLNWAIAYSTPYMTDAIHTNVFWIWAGFCCVRIMKFQPQPTELC
jgi:SP family sugar:H+ symporter-like MFS transporter